MDRGPLGTLFDQKSLRALIMIGVAGFGLVLLAMSKNLA